MDIIFQGNQTAEEAAKSLSTIIRLFRERYGVENFRGIHLSLTLLDSKGVDIELVDNNTSEVYRVLEVYRNIQEATASHSRANLKLVVDNTKSCT